MGKLNDNERFKHVDYHHTNLHATFARIRKEQAQEAKAKQERENAKVECLHNTYPQWRAIKAVK